MADLSATLDDAGTLAQDRGPVLTLIERMVAGWIVANGIAGIAHIVVHYCCL